MTAPETAAVIAALTRGGGDARFVGGCVRDAVAGRSVKDVDIATHLRPGAVMERLAAAGLKAVPTGLSHGTVTAISGGKPYEITTLRLDVETDGRRAVVAFTDDWTADAARRDFTINAMFMSAEGEVYDPFGGMADLAAGRIRFVGDARRRIREDVLRLLRFFRFYAHYGRPPPDPEALAACREHVGMLPRLSAERVRVELMRLLAAADPAPVVALMIEEGVLGHWVPEARCPERLARLVTVEGRVGDADPLRRLAALCTLDRAAAEILAERLRLSNAERERLARMAAPPAWPQPDWDPRAVRRALHRWGAAGWRDAVLLSWAADDDHAAEYEGLLRAADGWKPLRLPVQGRDALALGVLPGSEVGRLLAEVEAWWEAGDFSADRAACLERLRVLAAARGAP